MLPDGLWNVESENYQLFLVGRLLANKTINFEGLSRSVKSMINPVKGMEIKQILEGRFLLRFHHIIDRNRAWAGCPWSFEKNILILNGVGADENPMQVDLDWCNFFVHIHDFPLSEMNAGVATFIGNRLGKLGHIGKYCEVAFAEDFIDPGDDTPYGHWLRAPVSKPGQFKSGILEGNVSGNQERGSNQRRGKVIFGGKD
ncbi:UNVERIFIED_CONTAM: hypothetical protein Sradi_1578500 [Sesamum radiatum]|uniref:DUF4283 domain-containing protein n=1 Tax=Sesamum radiatum TaxID=300843 RepID=A0AAW2UAD3_SESRA